MRGYVEEKPAGDFVLEIVRGVSESGDVGILHYDRQGRPTCEMRDMVPRQGEMVRATRGLRTQAFMCRRCRELNRI